MRFLIAADSFKDALPAEAVCAAIARGVQRANNSAHCTELPLADGGEGTALVLTQLIEGQTITCSVHDPLGRPIEAKYGWNQQQATAFIDMAAASGLQLLQMHERNPLLTSTQGTGELIRDALDRGARKIVLGIGGSATNDGGMGMGIALGHQFLTADGQLLKGVGGDLTQLNQWIKSTLKFPKVEVLCDVDNPLCGEERGAAYIYGPQKGATPTQVAELDAGLNQLASVVAQASGQDYSQVPGAGAAGGLGFGALAFLGAELRSGIETVLHYANFEQHLSECDVVITGEGKLDNQTLQGKLIQGICQQAARQGKPVIALCGALLASPEAIQEIGLKAAFSIQSRPRPLAEALAQTAKDLEESAFHVSKLFASK